MRRFAARLDDNTGATGYNEVSSVRRDDGEVEFLRSGYQGGHEQNAACPDFRWRPFALLGLHGLSVRSSIPPTRGDDAPGSTGAPRRSQRSIRGAHRASPRPRLPGPPFRWATACRGSGRWRTRVSLPPTAPAARDVVLPPALATSRVFVAACAADDARRRCACRAVARRDACEPRASLPAFAGL